MARHCGGSRVEDVDGRRIRPAWRLTTVTPVTGRRPAASSAAPPSRSAGRGVGPRLDDPRRRRAELPRCRRRRDRRQRRARAARDRGGDGRAGRPARLRPRQRVHDRAARALRAPRSRAVLPSTIRRSTRSPAAPRRSRRRSSSPAPTTWPAASRDAMDRDRPVGELPRQHARRAGPVRPAAAAATVRGRGWAGSGTSRRPTRTAPASPGATRSATRAELAAELDRRDRGRRAGHRRGVRRGADRRARRSPRPCRPTATGRRSRRSAAATASCSSPTRS